MLLKLQPNTTYVVGIDLAKEKFQVCVIDERRNVKLNMQCTAAKMIEMMVQMPSGTLLSRLSKSILRIANELSSYLFILQKSNPL